MRTYRKLMISLIQKSLTITSIWNLHWIDTTIESQTEQCEKRFEVYGRAIADRLNEVYIEGNFIDTPNNKPNIKLWEDLAGDNKIFHEEFDRVITNEDIPEADDIFDPEEFDNYVNMELALDRHDDGPEFARVNKRLKYKDGRPIRIAAENPILDIMMYGVEYDDGYKIVMTANTLTRNLFSQFYQDDTGT